MIKRISATKTLLLFAFLISFISMSVVASPTVAKNKPSKTKKTVKKNTNRSKIQINNALRSFSLRNAEPKITKAVYTVTKKNPTAQRKDLQATIYTNLAVDSLTIQYITTFHMLDSKKKFLTAKAYKIGTVNTPKGVLYKYGMKLNGTYFGDMSLDYIILKGGIAIRNAKTIRGKSVTPYTRNVLVMLDEEPAPW